MKQTFNFLLMLVMVASVLSCKKSEPTPAPTPAQKIVGKYKITAATSTTNGVVKDDLASRPACAADDIREFTTDGKFIRSEGATSCTPPSSTVTASYALSADGKTLTLTGTSSSGVTETEIYTVVELTDSILKITFTRTEINAGVTTTATFNTTLTKV